jgi:hypothetical protein
MPSAYNLVAVSDSGIGNHDLSRLRPSKQHFLTDGETSAPLFLDSVLFTLFLTKCRCSINPSLVYYE